MAEKKPAGTQRQKGGSIMDRRAWYSLGIGAMLLVLIVTLVGVTAAGCGSPASAAGGPLKIGEADNGKAFTVKVGDTIEVSIVGNPTTGYAWTVALSDKDAAILAQVGEPAYEQDQTEGQIVGAGGTYTFTFKAAAKGTATLTLVYARAWESVEPLHTYAVTVTVE